MGLRDPAAARAQRGLSRIGPAAGVSLWASAILAVAAALWLLPLRPSLTSMGPAPVHLAWWAIAILEFAAWRFQVRFKLRRVSIAVSVSQAPMLIGLLTSTPWELVVGAMVGFALADLHRGVRTAWRTYANVCIVAMMVALGELAFNALAPSSHDPRELMTWLALSLAMVATSISDPLVIGVVWIFERQRPPVRTIVQHSLLSHMLGLGLAMAAAELLWVDPKGVIWLFAPLPLIIMLGRSAEREWDYARAVSGLGTLEHAHAAPTDFRESLQNSLMTAREIFGAREAELVLLRSGERVPTYRARVTEDGSVDQLDAESVTTSPISGAVLEMIMGGTPGGAAGLGPDTMAAPLMSGSSALGLVAVFGRSDQTAGPFTSRDHEVFSLYVRQMVRGMERSELERSVRDLAAREAELTYQNLHDALTGLGNRTLFSDRLQHICERERRTGQRFAIVFLDLDDMKHVNDTYGHESGDVLLRTTARRLRAALRDSDTAVRLGGDEFAVILEGVAAAAGVEDVVHRLVEAVAQPIEHQGVSFNSTVSAGVAISDGTADAEKLVAEADSAMYSAKRAGKGRFVLAVRSRDDVNQMPAAS